MSHFYSRKPFARGHARDDQEENEPRAGDGGRGVIASHWHLRTFLWDIQLAFDWVRVIKSSFQHHAYSILPATYYNPNNEPTHFLIIIMGHTANL